MKQLIVVPVLLAALFLQAGVEKKGSFDITEFEGQQEESLVPQLQKRGSFDLTVVSGKDPEIPSTPG